MMRVRPILSFRAESQTSNASVRRKAFTFYCIQPDTKWQPYCSNKQGKLLGSMLHDLADRMRARRTSRHRHASDRDEDAGQQKGQGGAADGRAEPVWRIGAFDLAVERVQPSEQKYVDLLILQLG